MLRGAQWWLVLLACSGCRQLFGIDDTELAGGELDARGDGAPGDGPPNGVDAADPISDAAPDAPPPDARACATTYPLAFNGHRYRVFNNNQSWDNALLTCEVDGGYLVIPDDAAENDFVAQLNAGQIWAGVSDRLVEGQWVTLEGEPVPPHYENWGANLPNGGNAEDCVQIYTSSGGADGEWDDSDCPNGRRPVCECDL